jgi:hypothetical protein
MGIQNHVATKVLSVVLSVALMGSGVLAQSPSFLSEAETTMLLAQNGGASETVSSGSFADGLGVGEQDGTTVGGKLGIGFVIGLTLGLIGTGIGYFMIEPSDLAYQNVKTIEGKSPEYVQGYTLGYTKRSKSKKRRTFLQGGVVGSIIAGTAYIILSNHK